MKYLLMVLIVFIFGGCASNQLTYDVIRDANYGHLPPNNYKNIIKNRLDNRLFDPMSAVYQFEMPSKGYVKGNIFYGTSLTFGWKVCGKINAKNRLGGYVGYAPFFVLFKDGKIAYLFMGEPFGSDKYGIVNRNIIKACNR